MERKFRAAAKILSIAIPALLLVMFILRSHYCREFFPMRLTDANEWDSANSFNMNVFAGMFLLSFLLVPIYIRTFVSAVLVDILIGVSLTDIVDRFIFHTYTITQYELATLIITVLIILIDHYVRGQRVKK